MKVWISANLRGTVTTTFLASSSSGNLRGALQASYFPFTERG